MGETSNEKVEEEIAEEKVEEEIAEEKVEEKIQTEKRKKVRRKIHSFYKIEEENLSRLNPFCERCGAGYFMADHGDRYTCGHCGFTRFKPS